MIDSTLNAMPTIHLSVALDPAEMLRRATRGVFPLGVFPLGALPTVATSAVTAWPTLPAWLVLRQGGLRDDLHRLAASEKVPGWFDPPVCLFAEVAQRWRVDGPSPLGQEERIALLSTVVARQPGGVFDRSGSVDAWVPAIDRLIGELQGEGITPPEFEAAQGARSDRDAFERDRDAQLAVTYREWVAALQRLDRSDGRDRLVRLAAQIAADPVAFSARLGGRRDVRIIGLADLRGGWRQLLVALASSPALDAVTVYASHALEMPVGVDVVVASDDGAPALAASLFGGGTPTAIGTVHLLEAPDAAREIERVAVRVRALLDSGVKPDRVAVLFRQARPGVVRMSAALDRLGIPVTARRRSALVHSGPAKALRALLSAAAQSFARHALVEVAAQPLLAMTLDTAVLQAAGQLSPIQSLEAWSPALEHVRTRCAARDASTGDWRSHRGLPSTDRVQATLASWRSWLPALESMRLDRTEAEWFAWVRQVLTDESWGVVSALKSAPADDRTVWRDDVRAQERIVAIADAWAEALATYQQSGTGAHSTSGAESFLQRLTLVLDADLITQPETGFGVVVSEALAAAWRPFDHVFVVGLSAGEFPLRQPPGTLMTERDRRALVAAGLRIDVPDAWRTREQELFRVICAAARLSLTLSWPSMDREGREVARSAYVDDVIGQVMRVGRHDTEDALVASGVMQRIPAHVVVTDGYPLVARENASAALSHASRVAAIDTMRRMSSTTSPNNYDGLVDDHALRETLAARFGPSYVWSATQLESLAKCGWSWFADRLLKLETRGDLDDGMEPTVRGALLHDALDRFFTAARHRLEGPAYLERTHAVWATPMLSTAFDEAWTAMGTTAWLGHPSLHAFTRAELLTQLRTYLDFEMTLHGKREDYRTNIAKQIQTGANEGEWSFDAVKLKGDGIAFLVRGIIDRIDVGVDERIEGASQFIAAIDYKSTVYATPAAGNKAGWEDGVVLQVPLYAKVLQTLRPEATLARLEYRTLNTPAIVHQLQFVKIERDSRKKTIAIVTDPEAHRKLDAALMAAGRRVRQARDGRFPAAPAPSCGCSPYCVARDICRIPGGPQEAH